MEELKHMEYLLENKKEDEITAELLYNILETSVKNNLDIYKIIDNIIKSLRKYNAELNFENSDFNTIEEKYNKYFYSLITINFGKYIVGESGNDFDQTLFRLHFTRFKKYETYIRKKITENLQYMLIIYNENMYISLSILGFTDKYIHIDDLFNENKLLKLDSKSYKIIIKNEYNNI